MIDILILAAGAGKRIGTDIPKVLRKLHGRSFLQRIVDSVSQLKNIAKVYIVVSHHLKELVEHEFPQCEILVQGIHKGTAKAVETYHVFVENKSEKVLVIPGDVPLISTQILQTFIVNTRLDNGIIVFTPNDGKEYGRVISHPDTHNIQIVEFKDCTEEQKLIPTCNAGIYIFSKHTLKDLKYIEDDNKQYEYYLTDIFKISSIPVTLYHIEPANNIYLQGVNTLQDLKELEKGTPFHI